MSVESLAAVLHHSRAKGTAKLVMVGIANHDGDGGAYPSVSTLARYANVDTRNVQRALEKLVQLGELAIDLQGGGSAGTPDHARPNRYSVLVSCPTWCDRSTQHRDTRESRQPNLRGLSSTGGGGSATPRRGRHPHPPAPAPPPPVAPAPPEPPIEPTPPVVSTEAQDARAVCRVCSRTALGCVTANRRVPAAERHDYSPPVRHASG